jgi:hypothetical protein
MTRRAPLLDPASVSRFHEALRLGHVDAARRLIHHNAALANARSQSSPRLTSLMVSAASPSSLRKNLTLLKLLLGKGASLRTKDDHRRTVLMVSCASGAHPNIVKCMLDWDDHGVLLWDDKDDQGHTALGLASLNGHGRLAGFILDYLRPDELVGSNAPLETLHLSIQSGGEGSVADLLRNRKLQWVVRNERKQEKLEERGEWRQTQMQEEATVASCVAAAVERGMVRVVRDLHRMNRRCVGHATWFALYSREAVCGVEQVRARPELEEIANLYRRDCVWERIKIVFLVRYAPERAVKTSKRAQMNVVAALPDAVFRIVAAFLKPTFDDDEEAQKERFKAVLDLSSW